MNITKSKLPQISVIYQMNIRFDYVDSFQGVFTDKHNRITSSDMGKAFFTSSPRWVDKLFSLRNSIVKLFGLKTSLDFNNRKNELDNFTCEPGDQLGLFKVLSKTENEVIFGEDDKHLNFRVSLFVEKFGYNHDKVLIISTIVKFNNWFGRLYFIPVRIFHKLIVPSMLRQIIRALENKTE